MALMLEVTKANGTVSRTAIDNAATKVAAAPGDRIRVIDSATGKSPADMTVKKIGDSLTIENLPDGKTVEITKFYADCSPATPCSLTVDPANGPAATITQTTAPVAALGENQALMYGSASSAAPAAAGTPPSGLLLGGLVLGGLALAAGGGGGGGGDDDDTPPPPPVDTTAPAAPVIATVAGNNTVNAAEAAAGVAVSGTAEASSTVSVLWGSTTKTTTADAAGNWSVNFTSGEVPADGATEIRATATDAAGNASTPQTLAVTVATADTSPPAAPVISAVAGDDTIDASEAAAGVAVSGTAEAGSTVSVLWGSTTKTAMADGTGSWNVSFAAGEVPAEGPTTISATASDTASNMSPAGSRDVTVAFARVAGTADADTLTGGSDEQLLDGGAGDDVLIGDAGGSVRNYQFDYWNGEAGGSYEDIGAGTGTGDPFTDYDLVRFLSGAQNGWTIGNTANTFDTGGAPATQTTGGAMQVVNNSVPFSFPDDTGGGGRFFWDTVGIDEAAGATISQDIATRAGEQYTLSLQVTKDDYQLADPGNAGFTENSSFEVWWNGSLLATWNGVTETWTGIAPVPGDLSTTRQSWTWEVTAAADSTALELRAYSETGAAGSHYGIRVDHATLDAVAAAGNDVLVGGAGSDLLFGQGGDDVLHGGNVGDNATTANGVDSFVYSLRTDNGDDVIKDFEVGVDRIQLVDAIDTYRGTTLIFDATTNPHGSRDVGHDGNTSANGNLQTANGDYNLTYLDFVQTESDTQYLTVTNDGSGSVKLSFFGESTTGVETALGSVVLEGVAFGTGAGQYDSVQDLFGSGFTDPNLGTAGSTVLYATMDGFHNALLTTV